MAEYAFSIQKILVGYDGSKGSDEAVDFAGAMASKLGATVLLCHVIGYMPEAATGTDAGEVVAAALDRLGKMGVVTQVATPEADPAEGILTTAEEQGADLIIVGSRGLGTFANLLLGSVAERVVRHAHIPVLVVR